VSCRSHIPILSSFLFPLARTRCCSGPARGSGRFSSPLILPTVPGSWWGSREDSTQSRVLTLFAQIETIRLVGVSHLFLVPQIRTSSYLTLLAEALPSLRAFSPGAIQEEALPDLRHIVVIDNTHQPKKFYEMLGDIHCAVDFREVLLWQDGGTKESRLVEEIRKTLYKDDVVNLQFTRSSLSFYGWPLRTEFNLKWNYWRTKGCIGALCFGKLMTGSC
jgi:hypothetical protein